MFFLRKKELDKTAWATLVYGRRPQTVEKETEEHLSALTTIMLMQHHRIIADSIKIVCATQNDETRRSRTDLCREHYQKMIKYKPYCNKEQLEILRQAEALIQKL